MACYPDALKNLEIFRVCSKHGAKSVQFLNIKLRPLSDCYRIFLWWKTQLSYMNALHKLFTQAHKDCSIRKICICLVISCLFVPFSWFLYGSRCCFTPYWYQKQITPLTLTPFTEERKLTVLCWHVNLRKNEQTLRTKLSA